jgi:hypothetical protein
MALGLKDPINGVFDQPEVKSTVLSLKSFKMPFMRAVDL